MKSKIFFSFILLICWFVMGAISFPAQFLNDSATIYVYMPDAPNGFKKTITDFFMDDAKVVKLEKARYFTLNVPAGKHSFFAKEKKFGGFESDFIAGLTYYIKVDGRFEMGKTRIHSVALVTKEEGEFAIKQFKTIKKDDVYNSKLVDMTILSK